MGLKRAILVQDLEATDKPLLADLSLHPRAPPDPCRSKTDLEASSRRYMEAGSCELVLFAWLWGSLSSN